MFSKLIALISLAAALPGAYSVPYWISYDVSTGRFPEDPAEGWTRSAWYGGAQRWFEDGALVLDSRQNPLIEDAYLMSRPGALDPGPSEVFSMRWTMVTDELQGPFESVATVYSDRRTAVSLYFALDHILSLGEGQTIATFEPGVFHDFELRSSSMLTYDLYCDGVLQHTGPFWGPTVDSSFVSWGDGTSAGASLSRWRDFQFGVVPEVDSVFLALILSLAVLDRARAR